MTHLKLRLVHPIPRALHLILVSQDVEPLGAVSTEEEDYQDHLSTFVSGLQT